MPRTEGFPQVHVTPETHAYIRSLEEASSRMDCVDPEDRDAVLEAYKHLSLVREALYQHVERMEARINTRSERSVVLRF